MTRGLAIGLLLALGLAAAALVVSFGVAVAPADVPDLNPVLTSFRLDTLDGSRLGPPDFPGDVVVVDIWASWCKPCDVQATILEGLREEYADRGVTFLALNTGEDQETVRKHVEEKPFAYPVLLDPEEEVMRAAELAALPTLLVLNPHGEVSYVSIGLTGASVVRRAIEDALAASPG